MARTASVARDCGDDGGSEEPVSWGERSSEEGGDEGSGVVADRGACRLDEGGRSVSLDRERMCSRMSTDLGMSRAARISANM